MDERGFQRLLRRTVAVPVALLVLLAGVLGVEIATLNRSLHQVDHTDQVISNARQALRYMVDMESSARGLSLPETRDSSRPSRMPNRRCLPASMP
jgi:CHASE3 domain sensor protein